jgi:hypothetical protein
VLTCDPADFTVLTMPARFEQLGDPHADMDQAVGSLEALLELAARDEASGVGDAPWPPHFRKMEGEPARVAPSKAKSAVKSTKSFEHQLGEGFGPQRFKRRSKALENPAASRDHNTAEPTPPEPTNDGVPHPPPQAMGGFPESSEEATAAKRRNSPGRRQSKFPLITIAQSPDKSAAEAGLDRWRAAHPEAAAHLTPDDILIDRMRGSAYIWYRIRLNLRHVPEDQRPAQATPDPDDDPTRAWREASAEPNQ